jgi:hypothetical protein
LDNQIVEEEREGEEYETNLRVNTEAPTVAEIKKDIERVKKWKSSS